MKWSYEPPRAEDVPARARARRSTSASLPPRGPGLRLDPDGRLGRPRWTRPTAPSTRASGRRARAAADPAAVGELARAPRRRRESPALVAGPDIDASGGWDAAVALAERQQLPVWATPAPGGGRLGFPEDHPLFQGVLPPAIGPVGRDARRARPRRWSSAPRSSPTTRTSPGRCCREGTALVAITERSRRGRARADGRRDRRRRRPRARRAARPRSGESDREPRRTRCADAGAGEESDPISPSAVRRARSPRCFPDDGDRRARVAVEPRWRCATSCGSRSPAATTSAPAAGSASGSRPRVGVQLAQPDRPVVCVIGEGSAQYAITALLDRGRLRGAGHLPRAAQRGVRDPQVVRRARVGQRRARARPAGARRPPRSRRATGSGLRPRRRAATRSQAALTTALAADGPLARRGQGRAGHGPVVAPPRPQPQVQVQALRPTCPTGYCTASSASAAPSASSSRVGRHAAPRADDGGDGGRGGRARRRPGSRCLLSSNRTYEIGLQQGTGKAYESFLLGAQARSASSHSALRRSPSSRPTRGSQSSSSQARRFEAVPRRSVKVMPWRPKAGGRPAGARRPPSRRRACGAPASASSAAASRRSPRRGG